MDRPLHLDFGGQPIRPGSMIVYPAQEGQSSVLKFAVVTRLERYTKWSQNRPTLRVIAASTHHVYGPGRGFTDDWALHSNGKEITLQYPERVFVVEKFNVPVRPRELLIATYNAWIAAAFEKLTKTARPAGER